MKSLFHILITCLILISCKKELPTIASILVKNSTGQPIPGATVKLDGNGNDMNPERFHLTLTTDGAGKAYYDFTDYYKNGQAGFAVLDITATKGNLTGAGLIKVAVEETTEELVVIE